MTDTERLDWLDVDTSRLEDVGWRMENEDESLREAIDALASMSASWYLKQVCAGGVEGHAMSAN